jgi:formyltetrahydrofolate hydrolase
MKNSAILLISCPDAKGEVATIADFVYRPNGNILHADEHADEESGLFLMPLEFDPKDFDIDLAQAATSRKSSSPVPFAGTLKTEFFFTVIKPWSFEDPPVFPHPLSCPRESPCTSADCELP